MTLLRSVPFFATLAVTTLFAIEGAAADRDYAQTMATPSAIEQTHKHRFVLGGGYEKSYFSGGIDGHYDDKLSLPSGHLGYAYRAVKGLEVGGDASFHSGMVLLLAPSVRGYLSIGEGDPVEVGLTARPSFLIAWGYSRTWTGPALSLGPDVRIWMSDNVGLDLAGEAIAGGGSTEKEPDNPYLRDAAFLAWGGSVSFVFRN
jgi:hypothetical protein